MGVAPTKALAKLANRIAKKYPDRTEGSYVIDSEEKRMKALKWIAVEDVWGIGRRNAKKLRAIGVNTGLDFAMLDRGWVLRNMTIVGLRLLDELNGISRIDMEPAENKQSIATTRTFEHEYRTFDEVNERIATFTVISAEKLRKQ